MLNRAIVTDRPTDHAILAIQEPPLSPKIARFHGGIWTPSNTWFLGLIRVLNPNGIWIGSIILQGSPAHSTMAGRPTGHATRSVTIGRIYVRNTASSQSNLT